MPASWLSSGGMASRAPIPMLAHLATTLPTGTAWRYEPKLDGFRGLLGRTIAERVYLASRNGKDLLRCFPEVAQAARVLPPGTILDGEIVIADNHDVPNLVALQTPLATSPRPLRAFTP